MISSAWRQRTYVQWLNDCLIVDRLMTNSRRAAVAQQHAFFTRGDSGQHASWSRHETRVGRPSTWTDVLNGSAQYCMCDLQHLLQVAIVISITARCCYSLTVTSMFVSSEICSLATHLSSRLSISIQWTHCIARYNYDRVLSIKLSPSPRRGRSLQPPLIRNRCNELLEFHTAF